MLLVEVYNKCLVRTAIISGVTDFYVLLLVCVGTNNAGSSSGGADRLSQYQEEYGGCQVVDGNLELLSLKDATVEYNLSFLSDIEEVTGYVMIHVCYARVIPLTNLRIIRGRKTYPSKAHGNKKFALFITSNNNNNNTIGLEEIQLKSLTGKLLLLKYHEKLNLQLV